ncbi:MAG: hypothetical protein E7032_09105 [Akkermansiaceae bacterium]|nr:hypothetical protein [Akkermansiaceae bacterium]
MKIFSVLLFCAAVVALLPAQAQGRRSRSAAPAAAAAGDEAAAPKTGVRFVICSPSGVTMPSPLYVRSGKEFKTISIGSRTPSVRIKPVGGVIEFWDQDPAPKMAEGDKKAPKPTATKLPDPIFSVSVPASAGSKSVCILSPNKEVKKTSTLFLNESDFPKKGMHIINLSSYPLQIITSASNDFKDKQESKIGVYRREDGICAENSWSFKGEKGQQVSFILSYYDKATKGFKRMRASSFILSERQSMVNIVVKDTTRNIPKLMPIQIAESRKDK